MAANNNLTDFLKSIADKIRANYGIQGKINPQEFVEYIGSPDSGGGLSTKVGSLEISNKNGSGIYRCEVFYLMYENGVYKQRLLEINEATTINNVVLNTPITFRQNGGVDIGIEASSDGVVVPEDYDYNEIYRMCYITSEGSHSIGYWEV